MVRSASFVAVVAPQPYDGVGRALSMAFPAVDQQSVPQDMLHLLRKLDLGSGSAKDLG